MGVVSLIEAVTLFEKALNMRLIPSLMAVAALLGMAACGDNKTDDVVKAAAAGGVAQPVSEETAKAVETQTALALGLTRKELEDADIVSSAGVDLGDVESLVIDSRSAVTHLVVEVDGPEDVKVLLPIDKVAVHLQPNGDRDLKTDMTVTELLALPKYAPAR